MPFPGSQSVFLFFIVSVKSSKTVNGHTNGYTVHQLYVFAVMELTPPFA